MKQQLQVIQPPVLQYQQFHSAASQFVVYTDASEVGLGAVLEQDNHVIAYASRVLTKSERNYSVIQKECLAIVYATKQFRHYLLGGQFQLWTDHAPLQWLSAQRMEGLLCQWALTLQEYSFTIVYRKGYSTAMLTLSHDVTIMLFQQLPPLFHRYISAYLTRGTTQ